MTDHLELAQQYGFLIPEHGLATSADEAVRIAAGIGRRVALKIASRDVIHKTDVGGVELDLSTEESVLAAYERIVNSVKERAPSAHVIGVSVEEMYYGGTEVIVGLNEDPQFGPVIMFGLGGIFTEVYQNIAFRVVPISECDARSMIREINGHPILTGYRHQPPVSEDMLVELLMKANRMALSLAGQFSSVDLNPVLVWGDQHRVLDVKILAPSEIPNLPRRLGGEPNVEHLDAFFSPKSVALVGASSTSTKVGGAVLESLARHGYPGRVFPINSARSEVMGLRAFPSLKDVPEPIDLVVVTVPLAAVPELIRDCASVGTHNMVVISAGGKELGGEGGDLEATIRRLARDNGVRIVGCNCIGVLDSESHFDTFFYAPERMARPAKGSIALITQSGTVGAVCLERLSGAGVSKFVSYGNRIDVDEGDLLAYLADDPATKVIACYIEGLEDGRKFLSVASEVSKKKPVVAFKAARSGQAAMACMSHTGFLGGSHRVVEGAFTQAGIISVDSVDELVAAAKSIAMQPCSSGPRVGLISNGAGAFVQAIDLLDSYGLEMPTLSKETALALRAVYPPYYLVQNPIDVTGSATSEDYEKGISALLRDPAVDIVMPWFVFQNSPLDEGIVAAMERLNTGDKPIVCGAMGAPYTKKMSGALEAVGVPVFHSIRDWVAAAYALAHGTR
jgi:3-hydroxypropionyl-CoA synthetase (ADP-forming)